MNAAKITRQSKSNLALAFVSLGRERRRDITVFYAFCRVIDDIADEADLNGGEKQRRLGEWRGWLRAPTPDEPALARDLRRLISKYPLTPEMLDEIIAGVEMDLNIKRFATFEQLRVYCYRVASAVGLVSIEIFGYRNPACKQYAIQLGLALQMTNIIRDVGKDLRHDRIYLPQEDLDRFGCRKDDLARQTVNSTFVALMRFEAERAWQLYEEGSKLLPLVNADSQAALWALICTYSGVLKKIESRGYDVFSSRTGLSTAQKIWIMIRARLGWWSQIYAFEESGRGGRWTGRSFLRRRPG